MCAQVQLSEYTMTSVTEGIEALASTRVSIRPVGGHADQGFVIHAQARAPSIAVSLHCERCLWSCCTLVAHLISGVVT